MGVRLGGRRVRALLIVPMAVPLVAALNILIEEPRNMIMADGGSAAAGTVLTVRKGAVFYRQPLARTKTAALAADVDFAFGGQSVRVAAADQLIEARVHGVATQAFSNRDTVYCTPAKLTGKKRMVGMSEVMDLGLDVDSIKKLRQVRTQACLIDARSDGSVERGFVADTSNRDRIVPVTISPVAVRKLGIARMPGDSEVRMRFDGPVGIVGNMSTSLQIVEDGQPLPFSNSQSMFRAQSLPFTVQLFGGRFTVLSYDKAAKTAQIRVDQPFAASEYDVATVFDYD